MKRENWLSILTACVAVSLFCGLCRLLTTQPTMPASTGTGLALAAAPLMVKVLVGLAALMSVGLLVAPFFQAQLKTMH